MKITIHKPNNPIIQQYIVNYLFIEREELSNQEVSVYRTFPNDNKCLSLYKGCTTNWNKEENSCSLKYFDGFHSRFYHNHKKPFEVSSMVNYMQVCILFRDDSISRFTAIPLHEIDDFDTFSFLFQKNDFFIEKLFSLQSIELKINLLDDFFSKRFINEKFTSPYLIYSNLLHNHSSANMDFFAKMLNMEQSTFYRNIKNITGKSPKQIQKEFRFRTYLNSCLNLDLKNNRCLNNVFFDGYFDQSHFIKEIKDLSGQTPKRLIKKLENMGEFIYTT
jgi:AraC-like DNA-binding protein